MLDQNNPEQNIYEDKSNQKSKTKKEKSDRYEWFKIINFSAIVGVVLYKIIITPINLSGFDFSDLLSLILAIFSVILSVMFYFSANDTSNQFYDNTYKFTKDISTILGRIEAGFGERLRHIDEGYGRLQEYYVNSEKTEKKIKNSEKSTEDAVKERDAIINELIEKAKINEGEKTRINRELEEKNRIILRNTKELSSLKAGLINEQVHIDTTSEIRYFIDTIAPMLRGKNLSSMTSFNRELKKVLMEVSPKWAYRATMHRWLDEDGNLTARGFATLKEIINGLDWNYFAEK